MMIELMSIMHFFYGPYTTFNNKFSKSFTMCKNGHETRYKALQDLYNLQKKNNLTLIMEDDELYDACIRHNNPNLYERYATQVQ